jgi:hypothetical protein
MVILLKLNKITPEEAKNTDLGFLTAIFETAESQVFFQDAVIIYGF